MFEASEKFFDSAFFLYEKLLPLSRLILLNHQ